jgi:putative FmdB family regulatory protein
MPLYEYQCETCEHRFEKIQKFTDPPPDKCPKCGGAVRKLFSSPAIQFKGTGFYITDYAKKSADGGDSGSSEKGDSGSSEKKEKSGTESVKSDSGSAKTDSGSTKTESGSAKTDSGSSKKSEAGSSSSGGPPPASSTKE